MTLFSPFCKTKSDAYTMNCDVRGGDVGICAKTSGYSTFVRIGFCGAWCALVVGMCLRVGAGTITVGEVRAALEEQRPLRQAWSAPAAGLYLSFVEYDDRVSWHRVFLKLVVPTFMPAPTHT